MNDEGDTDRTIDEKWESIKTIIKDTNQQLIENDGNTETLRNKWYDEKRIIAIEELKKAREKWLIKEEGKMKNRSITIKRRTK
jgi:hypothetical protein